MEKAAVLVNTLVSGIPRSNQLLMLLQFGEILMSLKPVQYPGSANNPLFVASYLGVQTAKPLEDN
jgi:hypothetical protein